MTPVIPKGWEKGTENAFTHGLTAIGDIYELQDDFPGIIVNGNRITLKAWHYLGIIPVRKVQVQPIELP